MRSTICCRVHTSGLATSVRLRHASRLESARSFTMRRWQSAPPRVAMWTRTLAISPSKCCRRPSRATGCGCSTLPRPRWWSRSPPPPSTRRATSATEARTGLRCAALSAFGSTSTRGWSVLACSRTRSSATASGASATAVTRSLRCGRRRSSTCWPTTHRRLRANSRPERARCRCLLSRMAAPGWRRYGTLWSTSSRRPARTGRSWRPVSGSPRAPIPRRWRRRRPQRSPLRRRMQASRLTWRWRWRWPTPMQRRLRRWRRRPRRPPRLPRRRPRRRVWPVAPALSSRASGLRSRRDLDVAFLPLRLRLRRYREGGRRT
mmetsp:Transcript_13457/g.43085  ORF Transcript_13457/g.43085 Transcript_13457/m.43085 type:complete len:319 (+) Transcript_13457:237-1193(+)